MNTNRNSLFFNSTIASMVLNIDKDSIFRVEEWAWVIYVHGEHISTFVSKKTFLEKFFAIRQQRAKNLYAYRMSANRFRVNNPENGNSYFVEFKGKEVRCQCEDYRKQLEVLGTGACKHIYACLKKMGFSSLREYRNAIQGETQCK